MGQKQAEEGRKLAVDSRDLAINRVDGFAAKMEAFEIKILEKIDTIKMPVIPPAPDLAPITKKLDALAKADIKLSPDDITEIGKTLSLSLRGAKGAETQKVTKEMQEQYMATLTPEQVEEMENAQFRKKFRDGILKFLPGSDE
jgi:hypothetical protein